jgi:hypothetical protein
MDIGTFGWCAPATVNAIFAAQDSRASGRMLVQDPESGNALTGYAGNVFNFRFGMHPEALKPDNQ